MRCNKKYLCSLFIKDKSVTIFLTIVVAFVYLRNPPVGSLAANPFSPKFEKSDRVVSKPLTRRLSRESVSPKFEKSYRVESNPPTRGLSCSPSTRLSLRNPIEWRAILPLGGLAVVQVLA